MQKLRERPNYNVRRRPTLLRLRTTEAIAIGGSVMPTHTTIATGDLAGWVVDQEGFLTDSDPDKTINQFIKRAQKVVSISQRFY